MISVKTKLIGHFTTIRIKKFHLIKGANNSIKEVT